MKLHWIFSILTIATLITSCGKQDSQKAVTKIPAPQSAECPLDFKEMALCGSYQWKLGPTGAHPSTLEVYFWEKGKPDVRIKPDANLSVWLWMPDPSMNHGSTPTTIVEKTNDPMVSVVSEINFLMDGAWEVWFEFKKNGVSVSKSKLDVQI